MPTIDVALKTLDPVHVLSLREVLSDPKDVGEMIEDGFKTLMSAGIMPVAPVFTLFHDPEFKPTELDVEIAFPVPDGVVEAPVTSGGRSFSHRVVSGGQAAVTVHQGPYDTLDVTYAAIAQWIADNGLHVAGAPQEAYLTAPDDPAGPITEIRFPVM